MIPIILVLLVAAGGYVLHIRAKRQHEAVITLLHVYFEREIERLETEIAKLRAPAAK